MEFKLQSKIINQMIFDNDIPRFNFGNYQIETPIHLGDNATDPIPSPSNKEELNHLNY